MKKKFYSVLAVAAMIFMLCSSCQKENVKPTQSVKQSGASSGTVSSSATESASGQSSDTYNASHPPTCPNHGG